MNKSEQLNPMNKSEQLKYKVRAEISKGGESAALRAMEIIAPEELAAGTLARVIMLGRARRNEYGLWPSPTPLGTRYYSNPEPVGYDELIFKGYNTRWGWDCKEEIGALALKTYRQRMEQHL